MNKALNKIADVVSELQDISKREGLCISVDTIDDGTSKALVYKYTIDVSNYNEDPYEEILKQDNLNIGGIEITYKEIRLYN